MASANWMKATTQKAGAMKKHLGQKEREQGNHTNPDIDQTLSKNNYALGCADYGEAMESMKRRTKAVDELIPPQRIRKDRVTCCFIELPCPRELTEKGVSDDFFKKAYQTLSDFFGAQNVHGGFVHKDEVHTYTDKDKTLRTSLEHIHVLVSAYTPEKGINGKAFETKQRLKSLNKELDDMCVRTYGVRLNTQETPEHKSVERLKAETELRKEADMLQVRAQEATKAANAAEERLAKLSEELTEKELSQIDLTPKKLSGGYKGLTPSEAQKMLNTAKKKFEIEKENTVLKEENAHLKRENAELKSPLSPRNMKAAKERADLDNQLRILKKTVGINADNYDDLVRQLGKIGLLQKNNKKVL